jgi:deoxyribodipyrimidine photo-lyase
MNYEDSDVRHWRFIYESVQDLQDKLNPTNSKLFFTVKCNLFAELLKHYNINTFFHIKKLVTSAPSIDLTMKGFFQNNKINWKESQMHGVIRRLKSRQHWDKRWEEVMRRT